MSSNGNTTAVEEKWVDETNSKSNQSTTIDKEFKELPDGGWRAWFIVFGTFLVSLYADRLSKEK